MKKHKTKIKAAIWDELYYSWRKSFDQAIRADIQFGGELDINILIDAFNETIELVPVVKSKWINKPVRSYWEIIQNFNIRDYFTVTEDLEDAENFMLESIDCEACAQIKVLIYRHKGKDNLRIVLSHMCFDGSSFMDFLELLSRYYSGLKQNSDFKITDFVNGERDVWQLFKNFTLKERLNFALKKIKHSKISQNIRLNIPCDKDASEKTKVIQKKIIEEELLLKLIEKSKKSGQKLNDIFIAAFGRSLFDISIANHSPMPIAFSIDLRIFMKEKKTAGLTNMSTALFIPFDKIEGESFEESVNRTSTHINEVKNNNSAMFNKELLRLLVFSFYLPVSKEKILKSFLGGGSAVTGISNVGVIKPEVVSFSGLKVEEFFMIGSVKFTPFPALFINTFNNRIYLSTASLGSKMEIELEKRVLDLFESYLINYVE